VHQHGLNFFRHHSRTIRALLGEATERHEEAGVSNGGFGNLVELNPSEFSEEMVLAW
jgi:hypothetical protein